MGWLSHLGKDNRGSRPRCVLLVDGGKEGAAARLTQLVGVDEVEVTDCDTWMPFGKPVQKGDGSWDTTPADEVELDKPSELLPRGISEALANWWLAVSENDAKTPNWDIASTCTVKGEKGLLLVEAKAHWNEVKGSSSGKRLRASASDNTIENHGKIGLAIEEAAAGLQSATGSRWKYLAGQSLPAIQPVCVVVEAGLAGNAGGARLSGIPLCYGYSQRRESLSLPGPLGAGHQGPL